MSDSENKQQLVPPMSCGMPRKRLVWSESLQAMADDLLRFHGIKFTKEDLEQIQNELEKEEMK